tara:strand:- start:199 stop:477 length:279 start_codon:yes stop_codon:yes gene_type:complete
MQTIDTEKTTLNNSVKTLISNYLGSVEKPNELDSLHAFMLEQIEPPLLEAAMEKSKWNQVRAAKLLGLSRGNLRKKLKRHFDDKYCGTRNED